MSQELLPVVLRFNNIAANSNVNFTFTTKGVSWSLGAQSGDSMGFTMTSDSPGGQVQSSIQNIEFTDDMLAMYTGTGAAALSSYTLTLFLLVNDGVDYLQGYCTLNEEASVMVYFGSQRAVEWRNGRISAVLGRMNSAYRSVLLSVFGAKANNRISLDLSTHEQMGLVHWCLGPDSSESSGIMLASANGALPLSSVSYSDHHLVFQLASGSNSASATSSIDFILMAYISWELPDLPYIYLKADCDSNVSIYAQVGNRQPQLVSQTNTVLTL